MSTVTISPGVSIQAAINNALAGDTIALNPGTFQNDNALSITKAITIKPATSGTYPNIKLNTSTYANMITVGASNVTFDGLDIDNTRAGGQGSGYITTNASISGWTIQNCRIHHFRRFLASSIACNGFNFINNHIYKVRGQSIEITNFSNVQFKFNWIEDSNTTGEGALTWYVPNTDVGISEISYNYITGHRIGIEIAAQTGLKPLTGMITIKHNTIDQSMVATKVLPPAYPNAIVYGFSFWNDTTGVLNSACIDIRDNIISRCVNYASWGTRPPQGDILFRNCLFSDNYWYQWPNTARNPNEWFGFCDKAIMGWGESGSSVYRGLNCLTNIDPMYTATGTTAHDFYSLRDGSPAKKAATDGTHIGAWQEYVLYDPANPLQPPDPASTFIKEEGVLNLQRDLLKKQCIVFPQFKTT